MAVLEVYVSRTGSVHAEARAPGHRVRTWPRCAWRRCGALAPSPSSGSCSLHASTRTHKFRAARRGRAAVIGAPARERVEARRRAGERAGGERPVERPPHDELRRLDDADHPGSEVRTHRPARDEGDAQSRSGSADDRLRAPELDVEVAGRASAKPRVAQRALDDRTGSRAGLAPRSGTCRIPRATNAERRVSPHDGDDSVVDERLEPNPGRRACPSTRPSGIRPARTSSTTCSVFPT